MSRMKRENQKTTEKMRAVVVEEAQQRENILQRWIREGHEKLARLLSDLQRQKEEEEKKKLLYESYKTPSLSEAETQGSKSSVEKSALDKLHEQLTAAMNDLINAINSDESMPPEVKEAWKAAAALTPDELRKLNRNNPISQASAGQMLAAFAPNLQNNPDAAERLRAALILRFSKPSAPEPRHTIISDKELEEKAEAARQRSELRKQREQTQQTTQKDSTDKSAQEVLTDKARQEMIRVSKQAAAVGQTEHELKKAEREGKIDPLPKNSIKGIVATAEPLAKPKINSFLQKLSDLANAIGNAFTIPQAAKQIPAADGRPYDSRGAVVGTPVPAAPTPQPGKK